jgi:endo-1,4-beta-D-glucanase Y
MGHWTSRPWKRLLLIVSCMVFCATGGCKDGPWMLWNSYAARFIDAQGRVFDPQGDQHTTSEGQAYALFFSLVDNDRGAFNRVLSWTQANLAQNDLSTHLPAWLWGKDKDGEWKTLDPNSASDADTWMAYTLVEAGRLWNDSSYTNLGRAMMAMIAKNEVANLPGFGLMLLPAPKGFQLGQVWTLNPSYLPLFIFQRLAAVDPSGPWAQIAFGIPSLIEQSSRHGYAMDWVDYVPGDGFYPAAVQRAGAAGMAVAPGGSYDAIRVYLWAGMLEDSEARSEILNAIPSMGVYLANHDAPPEKVSQDGIPSAQDGPVGFSAALLPYLRDYPGLSKESARQMIRMSEQRNPASGLYGKDLAYYDQNLALFGTGYLDGRFRFGPKGELKVEWKRR